MLERTDGGIEMNDFPCKDCKKRHYNCHATCEKYQKAKEKREKRNIERRMGITADGLSGRVVGMRWWS